MAENLKTNPWVLAREGPFNHFFFINRDREEDISTKNKYKKMRRIHQARTYRVIQGAVLGKQIK